jgi:predicted HNH restriction endonuclease
MVNPETDLVPVCPNCHVVLHLGMGGGCRSVEEVRRLIETNRRRSEPDAAGSQ